MAPYEEAEINSDGSIPNSQPGSDNTGSEEGAGGMPNEPVIDDSSTLLVFVILAFLFAGIATFILYTINKRKKEDTTKFAFFDQLERSQFDIQLHPSSDEYYVVKEAMIKKGWAIGQGKPSAEENKGTPGRELGQALMKRAISAIPLIQHMQKVSLTIDA